MKLRDRVCVMDLYYESTVPKLLISSSLSQFICQCLYEANQLEFRIPRSVSECCFGIVMVKIKNGRKSPAIFETLHILMGNWFSSRLTASLGMSISFFSLLPEFLLEWQQHRISSTDKSSHRDSV